MIVRLRSVDHEPVTRVVACYPSDPIFGLEEIELTNRPLCLALVSEYGQAINLDWLVLEPKVAGDAIAARWGPGRERSSRRAENAQDSVSVRFTAPRDHTEVLDS